MYIYILCVCVCVCRSETCQSPSVAHEENGESTVTMATETSDSGGVREGEVVMGEPLSEPSTSSEERCQNEEVS